MSIILSFLPFIAFAVLQGRLGSPASLAIAAAVAAALIVRHSLILRKSLKILEAGSMALFALMAVVTLIPQVHLSVVGVKLCVDVGMLAIVLGSLVVRKPFTLQYAREQVPAEIAALPQFLTINIKITTAWALAFATFVAADLAMIYLAGFTPVMATIAHFAALAAAGAYTAWLPKAAAKAAGQAFQTAKAD
jgi:hypothetical protein